LDDKIISTFETLRQKAHELVDKKVRERKLNPLLLLTVLIQEVYTVERLLQHLIRELEEQEKNQSR